jgi:PDZ domain/Aspartyl protease
MCYDGGHTSYAYVALIVLPTKGFPMRWQIVGIVLLATIALTPAARPQPAPAAKAEAKTVQVPYRLTNTHHVMVRAKINGKGPFNFIVDTGAPALFVAKKVAEAADVKAEANGRTTFDRFEIEGGVVFEKQWGKVDDLFQLNGMNGMGLAGVELHGVIGYNVLAQYRIEYDFTRPKLAWTKLDFEPQTIGGIGGRSAPAGLDAIGGIMKFLGGLMGMQPNLAVQPRGFLGAEFADGDGGVTIGNVLSTGPAAKAGLKPGDRVRRIGDAKTESAKDCLAALAKEPEGAKLTFGIMRDGREQEIAVELGKGL